ncbi:hypothetical protein JGC46_23200 [Salmonella enterica subsp. enterica serovar Derby]|nr:hypothetical protein [Salmonella enterica subsp. enterica serovar Derby]
MCYFPASIIQLESSPNLPASGFTLTQRRLSSPQVVSWTPLFFSESMACVLFCSWMVV